MGCVDSNAHYSKMCDMLKLTIQSKPKGHLSQDVVLLHDYLSSYCFPHCSDTLAAAL